jgi:2-polyprenyl-6-hydroxyphenyl methylase/3-demethylubiquinone-9 3-methyltransferase
MSFLHDIHDWLGGYPYESISPGDCKIFLENIGFKLISQNIYTPKTIFGTFMQIMGSGCDEYVFRKIK